MCSSQAFIGHLLVALLGTEPIFLSIDAESMRFGKWRRFNVTQLLSCSRFVDVLCRLWWPVGHKYEEATHTLSGLHCVLSTNHLEHEQTQTTHYITHRPSQIPYMEWSFFLSIFFTSFSSFFTVQNVRWLVYWYWNLFPQCLVGFNWEIRYRNETQKYIRLKS